MAPDTVSFTPLSTGILSPVKVDSSMAVEPSTITPSTGIFSPGLTTNRSPLFTSSILTVASLSSLIITAVCGARSIKLFKASVVRPLDIASNIFPTVIKVGIIAADSK